MRTKISGAQIGQMMKMASESLRNLSAENNSLREKVAAYEKMDRVNKIASKMEEKGLEPALSREEKVAGLLQRDDLPVFEEAVNLSAPQLKIASLKDKAQLEGVMGNSAEDSFAANLLSD